MNGNFYGSSKSIWVSTRASEVQMVAGVGPAALAIRNLGQGSALRTRLVGDHRLRPHFHPGIGTVDGLRVRRKINDPSVGHLRTGERDRLNLAKPLMHP